MSSVYRMGAGEGGEPVRGARPMLPGNDGKLFGKVRARATCGTTQMRGSPDVARVGSAEDSRRGRPAK